MKKTVATLAFLLVCTTSAFAQGEPLHFMFSMTFGFGTSAVLTDRKPEMNRWARRGVSFGLTITPGLAKEYFIDEEPDMNDVAANVLGAIPGIFLGELFAKKINPEKHLTKTEDLEKILAGLEEDGS